MHWLETVTSSLHMFWNERKKHFSYLYCTSRESQHAFTDKYIAAGLHYITFPICITGSLSFLNSRNLSYWAQYGCPVLLETCMVTDIHKLQHRFKHLVTGHIWNLQPSTCSKYWNWFCTWQNHYMPFHTRKYGHYQTQVWTEMLEKPWCPVVCVRCVYRSHNMAHNALSSSAVSDYWLKQWIMLQALLLSHVTVDTCPSIV